RFSGVVLAVPEEAHGTLRALALRLPDLLVLHLRAVVGARREHVELDVARDVTWREIASADRGAVVLESRADLGEVIRARIDLHAPPARLAARVRRDDVYRVRAVTELGRVQRKVESIAARALHR